MQNAQSKGAPVVELVHVGKKYRLYTKHSRRLMELLHPFGKKYHNEFWALKNINLTIRKGQTLGIIGRNGSGKSTLLQIISGVLQPSEGQMRAGSVKIAALLELGAGFNPALTGRENVYINGTLMGFSREEMHARIAAIEDFADIGEFFDQPVKFYSSGMYVRLAFSAAIHVDPQVLIVDEAISVGDAKFQHKCYMKFKEFQQKGVTIIFVSHDTNAVTRVCDHVVLLHQGQVYKEGAPDEVVNTYLELTLAEGKTLQAEEETQAAIGAAPGKKSRESDLTSFLKNAHQSSALATTRASYNKNELRAGDRRGEIVDYLITDHRGDDTGVIASGDTVTLYIKARFNGPIETPVYGISLKTLDGVVIYATNTRIKNISTASAKLGDVQIFRYIIPMPMRQGDYFLDVGLTEAIQDATNETLLDVRYSLAHLSITRPEELFDGLVELSVVPETVDPQSALEEVRREVS